MSRKIIRPIPTANSTPAEKAERSHVVASLILSTEVPGEKMFAGRAYDVSDSFAAYLVARKGWKYADANGNPTEETSSYTEDTKPRPGQEGWFAEELDRLIDDVKATEPAQIAPTAPPAQADAPPPTAQTTRRGMRAVTAPDTAATDTKTE